MGVISFFYSVSGSLSKLVSICFGKDSFSLMDEGYPFA